ncbi:hypothetical protein BD410DRAFT_734350, partial [Rickenella mellea]
ASLPAVGAVPSSSSDAEQGSPPLSSNSVGIITVKAHYPAWLNDAIPKLANDTFGKVWMRVLHGYVSLEEEYEFNSPLTGFTTEKRPDAIRWWIDRGRKPTPSIDDVSALASQWWAWWTVLQPVWRSKSDDGRPLIEGEGSWEDLKKPGRNGFLGVLMALAWWKSGLRGADSSDWNAAVADVEWALTGLLKQVRRKRPISAEGSSAPPKKKK